MITITGDPLSSMFAAIAKLIASAEGERKAEKYLYDVTGQHYTVTISNTENKAA